MHVRIFRCVSICCQFHSFAVQTTLPFGGNTEFSPIVIWTDLLLKNIKLPVGILPQYRDIKRCRWLRAKSYCYTSRSRCFTKLVPSLCADALVSLAVQLPCFLMPCVHYSCTISRIPPELRCPVLHLPCLS
jgi:hypothetical protein